METTQDAEQAPPSSNNLQSNLQGEIDLHPENKEFISREYAKKLALSHAYSNTFGHWSMQNSLYGNLIIPVLRTNEMIKHELQIL